jgi:hypothetical protein
VPDDVEEQAEAMILHGREPPDSWRRFIRRLNFAGTPVDRLNLLSALTGLQRLDFARTQVSDVSPLSGLTALQSLDLWGRRWVTCRRWPVSAISGLMEDHSGNARPARSTRSSATAMLDFDR